MGVRKLVGSDAYCYSGGLPGLKGSYEVTLHFNQNGFWGKHVAREGSSTRDMATARDKLKKINSQEDADIIDAILELESEGVHSAAGKSTIIRLKSISANEVIEEFARCLVANYDQLDSWDEGVWQKELPLEIKFRMPNSVVSYEKGANKTYGRSMVIGAKLITVDDGKPRKFAFDNIHCCHMGSD